MTDFIPQSSDKRSGDTSPYHSNVIAKGKVTITMASQSTGFKGSATIALPLDANVALLKPEAIAFNWNLGAGASNNYPIPFTEINTSGAIARNGELSFTVGLKPSSYSLLITIYDANIQQNSLIVYYRVVSVAP